MSKIDSLWINNLSHSFLEGSSRRAIFNKANLKLPSQSSIAIVAQSGSGKTSLLNFISGMDLPNFGEIYVAGIEITSATERERTFLRRQYVGFIFQFFNLIPTMTVEENIVFPLQLQGKKAKTGEIKDILKRLNLSGREKAFPDILSGGERQRVAIARTILQKPALILADEPTGSLDEKTTLDVLKVLAEIISEQKSSLIITTHSTKVASIADRVMTIHNQQILEVESVKS